MWWYETEHDNWDRNFEVFPGKALNMILSVIKDNFTGISQATDVTIWNFFLCRSMAFSTGHAKRTPRVAPKHSEEDGLEWPCLWELHHDEMQARCPKGYPELMLPSSEGQSRNSLVAWTWKWLCVPAPILGLGTLGMSSHGATTLSLYGHKYTLFH